MIGALQVLPVNTGQQGALQVMSAAQHDAAMRVNQENVAASQNITEEQETGLGGMIQREFDIMVRHRDGASGWSDRMLMAQRQFNGQYEPDKLAEIQKFGGSTIYGRMTAMKCRGATALLRDIYLAQDRPYGLEAPADVEIPLEIFEAITQKVMAEVATNAAMRVQVSKDDVRDRTLGLIEAARQAAKKKAVKRVKLAEDKIETILREGGFYTALAEVLADVTEYPLAVLKGPFVRMDPVVRWQDGVPYVDTVPKLCYARVSPFDFWFSPGASNIANANVIQRIRFTRAELNDLLDLPGYDHEKVRLCLEEYSRGLSMHSDGTDSQRAVLESRENPIWNETGLIDALEFHGNIQGQFLLEYGMEKRLIPDPMRDYAVQVWKVGRHVIKVQLSPSPRKRHPFWVTSFEKIAGSIVGNALPDLLADLQDASNATLRALVNNMAMSSGPQVVVNEERLSGMENGEEIYPWKRWRVTNDPLGGTNAAANKPIEFFQPQSNAQELLAVFMAFQQMADDTSAIPRYLQGSAAAGAGRTASGLAMLLGNASKVLQTVAGNVDADIIAGALRQLLDIVLLTDETDMLDGTENVVVKGVTVAMQRETLRARQLEFLQATMNPVDMQITGPKGRAAVLRAVSQTLGLEGDQIVPSEEQLEAQQETAAALAAASGVPGHAGVGGEPPGALGGAGPGEGPQPMGHPGNPAPQATRDMGPRANLVPTRIAGGVQ